MSRSSLARPLSSDDERALLELLAAAIDAAGVERVLTRPVVLPDERHFPDPWTPSNAGVGRLAQRLLRFAGCDDVAVAVTSAELVQTVPVDDEHTARAEWARATKGAPVLFAGLQSGERPTCVFVADLAYLTDADTVVSATAREVARAITALEGLDDDELAVDALAIALGFGVLVANDSLRHRSHGEMQGQMWVAWHSRSEAGSLSPRAASFLLGALLAARGLDDKAAATTKAMQAALEPNQRTWTFDAARRLGPAVAARLGLPPSASARASIQLDALLAPLPADGLFADEDVLEVDDTPPLVNDGHPVFRAPQTRLTARGLGGTSAFISLGFVLADSGTSVAGAAASFLGAAIMFARFGFRRLDTCSGAQCDKVLEPGWEACPACGGVVVGRLRPGQDRFDAEDEWRRAQAAPSSSS